MKSLIRKILREGNQDIINQILDKINLVGYDNLSDYEKSLLGNVSYGDDVIQFLNDKYGEFAVDKFTEKTYGGKFIEKGYNFLNDDLDLMMKLVLTVNGEKRNVLYISNDIISSLGEFKLSGEEMDDLLIKWLNKTYPQFKFDLFKIRQLF
jgi:hypothetical protein